MDMGLQGKVAMVTAASRGLGFAAAQEFAHEGASVAICSRSEQIEKAANTLRERGADRVLAVRADVAKADDVEGLVRATLQAFGRIDILVTNAGGPAPGSFLSLKPQDWQEAVSLTLMSVVYLCYAVVPHMVDQGSGSIVASQSSSVKQGVENLVLSNSIRMAVIGLVKSLANELGPKGIRVNSINPGWTLTERVQQLMADRAARSRRTIEQEIARITSEIPFGRMGTPEEYARAVVWLASPAASFVNGHALVVDGGLVKTAL